MHCETCKMKVAAAVSRGSYQNPTCLVSCSQCTLPDPFIACCICSLAASHTLLHLHMLPPVFRYGLNAVLLHLAQTCFAQLAKHDGSKPAQTFCEQCEAASCTSVCGSLSHCALNCHVASCTPQTGTLGQQATLPCLDTRNLPDTQTTAGPPRASACTPRQARQSCKENKMVPEMLLTGSGKQPVFA